MKQKLRIVIVILMALSLVVSTLFYFYHFEKQTRIYYAPTFYSYSYSGDYYKNSKKIDRRDGQDELLKIAKKRNMKIGEWVGSSSEYLRGLAMYQLQLKLGKEKRSYALRKNNLLHPVFRSKFLTQTVLLYILTLLIGGLFLYLLRESERKG